MSVLLKAAVNENAPFSGAYTRTPGTVPLDGLQQWLKTQFTLRQARFANLQNRGADFRFVVEAPEFGSET